MKKTSTLYIALFLVSGIGNTVAQDVQTITGKKNGLVVHRFDLKGCAFTLRDKSGNVLPYLDTESRKKRNLSSHR